MTQQPTPSELLTLANLQMAAEALLNRPNGTPLTGDALSDRLQQGNNRASKFTEPQAKEFVENWEVVEQNNTTTGFSGTLFRNRQTGELVMSLRSTEFVDDAARDNKATNELEISKHGFAFGQLRDLRRDTAKMTRDEIESLDLAGQRFPCHADFFDFTFKGGAARVRLDTLILPTITPALRALHTYISDSINLEP